MVFDRITILLKTGVTPYRPDVSKANLDIIVKPWLNLNIGPGENVKLPVFVVPLPAFIVGVISKLNPNLSLYRIFIPTGKTMAKLFLKFSKSFVVSSLLILTSGKTILMYPTVFG